MSTKSTLAYARTKDVTLHIYQCFVKGHAIDMRFKEFNTTLLIDKEQANSLVKQIERRDRG